MKTDSILENVAKLIGGLLIAVLAVLYFVRFEGPGAEQWFSEHPVIHFFYKLIHFF